MKHSKRLGKLIQKETDGDAIARMQLELASLKLINVIVVDFKSKKRVA